MATKPLRSYTGPRRGPKQRKPRSLGPTADTLIERCRAARLEAEISQGEVARAIGVDRSQVPKIESRVHEPGLSKFLRYATACGMTVLVVPTEEVEG